MFDAINLWLTDGYHDVAMCMNHDTVWVITLALLRTGIVVFYLAIAWMWRMSRRYADGESAKLFGSLVWIFVLCALCGYAFQVVAILWPGYRLLAFFLLILNIVCFRFLAINGRQAFAAQLTIHRLGMAATQVLMSDATPEQKIEQLDRIHAQLQTPPREDPSILALQRRAQQAYLSDVLTKMRGTT